MVPNEWKRVNLGKLLSTSVRNGYSPNAVDHETGYVVLGLGALTDRALDLDNVKPVVATEQVLKTQLSHGDFLISRSNTPDKVGRSVMFRGELKNCSYPDLMMKFRVDESIADPQYIESYLQSTKMRRYFRSCAAGSSSSMVKITKSVVEKAPILLPELTEQRKIVEVLSTWDKAITTTKKLIKTSKQQKKSLMQQLLTGKKRLINLETGEAFEGEWEQAPLSDWLVEYKEKSLKQDQYRVYTSSKSGLIPQDEYFGNSRISDRNNIGFHVLPSKHMTYRSRSDDGFFTFNIFKGNESGIISHYYPVFTSKGSNSFFIALFEQYRKTFGKHSVGTSQKVLSFNALKVIKFKVPKVDEQQKIASVLSAADKEVEVLQTKLAHFKQEKKALMQQLLTGKVRSQYEMNNIDDMKFEPIIKLNKLVVKNYRRLEDLTVRLSDSNINVFIGNNGTGKTSILESIALSLSWLVARIKTPNGNGGIIGQSDINVHNNNATIGLSTEVIFDSSRLNYLWNTSVSRNGFVNKDESEYTQLKYLTEKIRNSITIDKTTSIPLVVYYGVDRTNVNVKFSSLKSKYDRFDAFDFPIYKGASINGVFDWFHYRENIQNEKNIGNSGASNLEALLKSQGLSEEKISEALKLIESEDEILKYVKMAVLNFVDGISDIFIEREPEIGLFVIKNNVKVNINQLSQGERVLVSLVADIARRLSILNHSGNPCEGKGIILIDELELHLHPKWQQNIVENLRNTFPNVQFIITTHSPQILSTVRKDEISIINFIGDECYIEHPLGETYGIASNDALVELMMVDPRPPLTWVNNLKEYLKLIDIGGHESSEGKKLRETLEHELGESHHELRKADRKIRRKGLLSS